MEAVSVPTTPKTNGAASSAQGNPVARTPSFEDVNINLIHESKHNPRQHFDEAGLKELAESIREVGVLTPCLVRPRTNGGFELAAGHRRYRASKMAGLATIPCIVRPMTDDEFMAVLTIENLQREDVHPLDEAKGYEALVNPPYRWKVETIAGKVGKSTRYVYDSLNLVKLNKTAQDLFWAGKIEKSHAVLLTRLTNADQDRCINDDNGLFRGEETLYVMEEDKQDKSKFAGHVACSVRELQDWIKRHVRFNATKADAVLYPETVQAVAEATEDKRKIIPITHEFLAHDDVRSADNQRVYGERAWKRADGKEKSKPCEYAALGVIASGRGYGEAFNVCIRKDKCTVHWGAEVKARAKIEKAKASGDPTQRQEAQQQEQQRQERERAEQQRAQQAREIWEKATPAIQEALAKRVKTLPTKASGFLAQTIIKELTGRTWKKPKALIPIGTTADDVIRYLGYFTLALDASHYHAHKQFPKSAKAMGIDLEAILKAYAPKAEQPAPATVQTSAKRKGRAA